MSQAYVPSLDVLEKAVVSRERRLPLKGNTLVVKGSFVTQETIVASTELPGKPVPISAAVKLGVSPTELMDCMLKKEGDSVEQDEVIGMAYSLFGLFKTPLVSPIRGTIDSISRISGQIILREAPIPVEVNAYISGEVTAVEKNEGVTLRTEAALVQGIFGIGKEKVGSLVKAVSARDTILESSHIKDEHAGKILIGGSLISSKAIARARDVGVLGIIGGGLNDRDLKEILGYDLGVAITGNEEGPTLIVTEGFGPIAMSQKIFDLLCSHGGRKASINGATQIRAGVIRPEVIIPLEKKDSREALKEVESKVLKLGAVVRVIRSPRFGELGEIVELPHEQTLIPTGARVRVAVLKMGDGVILKVPRANLELV